MLNRAVLVSVIIPSYNHGRFILQTIESAIIQSRENLCVEIIIIDDGSRDNTREVLDRLENDQIQIVYQENQGTSSAINKGLSLAKGEYISILNSDDIYHQDRFVTLVSELEKDPDCYLAFSKVQLIDGNGKYISEGKEYDWLQNAYKKYEEYSDFILSILIDNFICTSSNFLFRKSLIEKIGDFNHLTYVNDLDFILRATTHFKFSFSTQELLLYRIHTSNTIKLKKQSHQADFAFEMSWVIASLLDNNNICQLIDARRLLSTLFEICQHSKKTVLLMIFYLKKTSDKKSILKDDELKKYFLGFINKELNDIAYIGELEEAKNWFENTQIPTQEAYIRELSEKLTVSHTENSKFKQSIAGFISEINYLKSQNQEIWEARNWFKTQLESILNSKRHRLIQHVLDMKSGKNIKFNSLAICRIILPNKYKQYIKKIKQKGASSILHTLGEFTKQLIIKTRKRFTPLVKYTQTQHHGPLVSIIAPCFNYGDYLQSFIDCLQNQHFKDFETILIDDGSTDPSTIEIIKDIENRSINNLKVIRQSNQGVISARNTAILAAKGKYIFPFDPDDMIDKTFLEKCVLYLESSSPDCFVYSWTYSTGEEFFIWETYNSRPIDILNENRIGFVMFPRTAFEKTSGYNPIMRDGYEDWEFAVNLVRSGYVGKAIPEPLYFYHVKQGSRNDFAKENHAELKRKINDLHRQYIVTHKADLEKRRWQQFLVTNPLINLIKQEHKPDKHYYLIDLYQKKFSPAEMFFKILTYADLLDANVLLTCDQKWSSFFHLNPKSNLFVYHPGNYHPERDGEQLYHYLKIKYQAKNSDIFDFEITRNPETYSRKTNILYIAPWLVCGGADTTIVDWFQNLNDKNFNAYCVTTEPKNNTWIYKIRGFSNEIYDLPSLGCISPQEIENFILDFIKNKNIHIVHIMNSRLGYDTLPAIKRQFSNVVTVVQFHCFDYLENGRLAGYPYDIPMKYDAYIDYYNVVSHALKEEILALFPYISRDKFQVIYCCTDTNRFNPEQTRPDPQILKYREPNKFNILFIGRLDRQKQPLIMAQIANNLKTKHIPFIIHVLGEGNIDSQENQLREYIDKQDLSGYVKMYGAQSHETMLSWYKVGDVLLMTSEWEGIPIVLYEAMAMRLVCIAPDIGGIKELLHEAHGFIVSDYRDVEKYVSAMSCLYENNQLATELGNNAREWCAKEFDIKTMKKNYEDFYTRVKEKRDYHN